jgi:cysteine desulfurase
MTDLIYLDAAASTPIAPEALSATVEALQQTGNPGSAHAAGHLAAARVESAREALAQLLHVGPAGVIFVGSATEANNLAIRGLARSPERGHVITTAAEHPSVLATVADVAATGAATHVVPVTSTGEVDLPALAEVLCAKTAIVSIHAANNETGVVQPLDEIVELAHSVGAVVHVDASQLMAWGETELLGACDLVTVSSHKMYGPQGAAALIARPSVRARLRPQVTGGGQERGMRSGTVNVAAISGFGAAAELSLASGRAAADSVRSLRAMLLDGLVRGIGDVVEHGAKAAQQLPGILNVAVGASWSGSVESEALLARLPRVAASTGSACHAGTPGPSPVLLAMGVPPWEAARSIRLSISRYTTKADIDDAIAELGRGYADLRSLLGPTENDERYTQ